MSGGSGLFGEVSEWLLYSSASTLLYRLKIVCMQPANIFVCYNFCVGLYMLWYVQMYVFCKFGII